MIRLILFLIAVMITAMAILSVQNATPVTVKFLLWRSIEIPVGVVLAFALSGGVLGAALSWRPKRKSLPSPAYEPDGPEAWDDQKSWQRW